MWLSLAAAADDTASEYAVSVLLWTTGGYCTTGSTLTVRAEIVGADPAEYTYQWMDDADEGGAGFADPGAAETTWTCPTLPDLGPCGELVTIYVVAHEDGNQAWNFTKILVLPPADDDWRSPAAGDTACDPADAGEVKGDGARESGCACAAQRSPSVAGVAALLCGLGARRRRSGSAGTSRRGSR